jgi:hypothetical protein
MEVISAQYSRTGTESMQLALERLLDGPVQHGGTHAVRRSDGQSLTFCPDLCLNIPVPFPLWHLLLGGPLLTSTDFDKWGHKALQAQMDGDKQTSKFYLRKMMDGFVGGTDFPTCIFVEELHEMYPDAKVRI